MNKIQDVSRNELTSTDFKGTSHICLFQLAPSHIPCFVISIPLLQNRHCLSVSLCHYCIGLPFYNSNLSISLNFKTFLILCGLDKVGQSLIIYSKLIGKLKFVCNFNSLLSCSLIYSEVTGGHFIERWLCLCYQIAALNTLRLKASWAMSYTTPLLLFDGKLCLFTLIVVQ